MGGIRTLAVVLAVLFFSTTVVTAQTLKSGHGDVDLVIDSSRIAVKFSAALDITDITTLLTDLPGSWNVDNEAISVAGFITLDLPEIISYGDAVAVLNAIGSVDFIEPRYETPDGTPVRTTERLVIGLSDAMSQNDLDQMLSTENLASAERLFEGANVFVVVRAKGTMEFSFQKSESLAGMEGVLYAYPEIFAPIAPQAYTLWDHYHQEQFHLKNVIGSFNDSTVWDIGALGDSIIVAVVDDGLVGHEDLDASRILPGYDFFDHDNDPSPGPRRNHGLYCAGIIGAAHSTNPEDTLTLSGGIVGVAPNVRFLPIKIFADSLMEHDLASNIDVGRAIDSAWQWGADILNCSFADEYYYPNVDSAILRAGRDGRGGKGCLIIAAAGNLIVGKWPLGTLRYPALYPESFVVGACDLDDSVLFYSQYDSWLPNVDVLAPSGERRGTGASEGVWTLDQMGDLGENRPYPAKEDIDSFYCDYNYGNNRNYFCEYDGTSASTAFVSGIAALLLSYNPDLTREEAYAILDFSAIPLTATVPDLRRGFGRVDAVRALVAIARGDCNGDGKITLSDINKLVNHLFITFEPLLPVRSIGDVNCSGSVNLTDLNLLKDHLFFTFEPLVVPCYEY